MQQSFSFGNDTEGKSGRSGVASAISHPSIDSKDNIPGHAYKSPMPGSLRSIPASPKTPLPADRRVGVSPLPPHFHALVEGSSPARTPDSIVVGESPSTAEVIANVLNAAGRNNGPIRAVRASVTPNLHLHPSTPSGSKQVKFIHATPTSVQTSIRSRQRQRVAESPTRHLLQHRTVLERSTISPIHKSLADVMNESVFVKEGDTFNPTFSPIAGVGTSQSEDPPDLARQNQDGLQSSSDRQSMPTSRSPHTARTLPESSTQRTPRAVSLASAAHIRNFPIHNVLNSPLRLSSNHRDPSLELSQPEPVRSPLDGDTPMVESSLPEPPAERYATEIDLLASPFESMPNFSAIGNEQSQWPLETQPGYGFDSQLESDSQTQSQWI